MGRFRCASFPSPTEEYHVRSGLGRERHRRAVQLLHSRSRSADSRASLDGHLPVLPRRCSLVLSPRLARAPLVDSRRGVVEAEARLMRGARSAGRRTLSWCARVALVVAFMSVSTPVAAQKTFEGTITYDVTMR